MSKKTDSVKKFWADHKDKIKNTALVITTLGLAIEVYALRQHNDYLREKGLYDEFYAVNEED